MIKLLFLLFSLLSFSEGFIEPYVGTSFLGDMDYGKAAQSAIQGKMNKLPFVLGGRLGFKNLGFIAGIEYATTQDLNFDQNNSKELGDLTEMGAFIGYEFPVLVRGYIGYQFAGRLDADRAGDFKKLSGPKIGASLKIFPKVRLNLEYKLISFDEFTNTDPNKLSNIKKVEADLKMFAATLSVPLEIFN